MTTVRKDEIQADERSHRSMEHITSVPKQQDAILADGRIQQNR